LLQEFLFGNYTIAMLEEVDEHLKYLGLDCDQLAGTAQFTALRVEFIVAKAVNHVLYPYALTPLFPRQDTFYIKHSKPSSRFSYTPFPGPTLTSMVRIRPDMVSMWSRFAVSNTVHW
jgi:hypothetical protein